MDYVKAKRTRYGIEIIYPIGDSVNQAGSATITVETARALQKALAEVLESESE